MQTKFLIVAESGAGKDSLMDRITHDLGLTKLISYTTRPRRENEGNTHTFITDEEANELLKNEQIVAYTKIGEFRYFSTMKQFLESNYYIIDPNGVEYLKLHNQNNKYINIVVIYIKVNDDIRMERALKRGDNLEIMQKRFKDEKEQFMEFRYKGNYNWAIENVDFEHCVSVLKTIIGGCK